LDVSSIQPLKASFRISTKHLSLDISYFMEISWYGCLCPTTTFKLINTLRRHGFHTIEDIVETSAKKIRLIKRIGDKSFELLLVLLRTISEDRAFIPPINDSRTGFVYCALGSSSTNG
jgi:hypothetical protein